VQYVGHDHRATGPKLKTRGCDNVLPGQDYHIPLGVVTDGGMMINREQPKKVREKLAT
jgi:hypothetical protein